MKHTKEQLQGMSDFEVNCELAYLVSENVHSIYRETGGKDSVSIFKELDSGELICCEIKDYCNNPSDIMPLAFEHGIHFGPQHKAWYAIHDTSMLSENPIELENENPLRAIACCLILVLQDKE